MPKGIYERTPEMRTGKYVKTKGRLEKMRNGVLFKKDINTCPVGDFKKDIQIILQRNQKRK